MYECAHAVQVGVSGRRSDMALHTIVDVIGVDFETGRLAKQRVL